MHLNHISREGIVLLFPGFDVSINHHQPPLSHRRQFSCSVEVYSTKYIFILFSKLPVTSVTESLYTAWPTCAGCNLKSYKVIRFFHYIKREEPKVITFIYGLKKHRLWIQTTTWLKLHKLCSCSICICTRMDMSVTQASKMSYWC